MCSCLIRQRTKKILQDGPRVSEAAKPLPEPFARDYRPLGSGSVESRVFLRMREARQPTYRIRMTPETVGVLPPVVICPVVKNNNDPEEMSAIEAPVPSY